MYKNILYLLTFMALCNNAHTFSAATVKSFLEEDIKQGGEIEAFIGERYRGRFAVTKALHATGFGAYCGMTAARQVFESIMDRPLSDIDMTRQPIEVKTVFALANQTGQSIWLGSFIKKKEDSSLVAAPIYIPKLEITQEIANGMHANPELRNKYLARCDNTIIIPNGQTILFFPAQLLDSPSSSFVGVVDANHGVLGDAETSLIPSVHLSAHAAAVKSYFRGLTYVRTSKNPGNIVYYKPDLHQSRPPLLQAISAIRGFEPAPLPKPPVATPFSRAMPPLNFFDAEHVLEPMLQLPLLQQPQLSQLQLPQQQSHNQKLAVAVSKRQVEIEGQLLQAKRKQHNLGQNLSDLSRPLSFNKELADALEKRRLKIGNYE